MGLMMSGVKREAGLIYQHAPLGYLARAKTSKCGNGGKTFAPDVAEVE